MENLILLDRDGVINTDSKNHVRHVDAWIPLPKSIEAIAKLKQHNQTVAVATNQSGVGRGYFSLDTLNQMHAKMQDYLAELNASIDHIFFCPHHPNDNCECRKPKPGMIHMAAKHFNIACENIFYIGDSMRDIEAAIAANAKPVLVLTGNGAETLKKHEAEFKGKLSFVEVFDSLHHFVESFLG